MALSCEAVLRVLLAMRCCSWGTALYVHLMVYMGLSLFIIRQANMYLVVCVLMRITLHYEKKQNCTILNFNLQCILKYIVEVTSD